MEYLRFTGPAVVAMPRGVRGRDDWVGSDLFG